MSCSMGSTIAGEVGAFGHKPSVLLDLLAGKRAEVGTKVGAYMRTFSGDCSPTDLDAALQVKASSEFVHQDLLCIFFGPCRSHLPYNLLWYRFLLPINSSISWKLTYRHHFSACVSALCNRGRTC